MGIFVGRGNWVGVWVEGRSLGWGCFRGVRCLGRCSGLGGVFRGCSRVGVGGGGSWVVLLGVEVPFVLSSLLFALCIDISVEDRGDFSGDSVHSLTFLWYSLNFFFFFLVWSVYKFTDPGGCLLWGVVGRVVCWGRPFPVRLFWVRPFDLSFLLLSPML